jgi:4-amino-4-deoxy-L-arabinose transferase-like glycosyltransferase
VKATLAEREWRETSDTKRALLTLVLILAIAAALRFWGLGAGIPYAIGVDEPELMNRAVLMMRTGDYNPRFFDYGGLYLYLQLIVASLRFLAGAIGGEWRSLSEVGPENFYLWGRALTAAFGTLTVLLVYQIGMRWGTRYALLAAALMAVMPLHVRESHYVLTDVPVTFFVTLTFLLSLRAHEQPRLSSFAWAGAAAGLAIATKYTGGLVLLLPLLAIWMTPADRVSRTHATLAVIAACFGAFLVAAPYSFLDLPGFLNGFARLAAAYKGERPPEPAWLLYLKHLRGSLQWPALLLAIGGLVLGVVRAVRGPGRVRWTFAVVFPLLYFWFISRQTLVFGRYLLPIVPFLCILAAAAVVAGVSLLRRFDIPRAVRTALIVGLTIAAILPPGIQAVNFSRDLGKRSTTAMAYDWIRANIPRGSVIAVESRGLLLPQTEYKTENVPRLIWIHPTRTLREHADYVSQGVEYIVASSQGYGPAFETPHRLPDEYAAYRRLFDQSREVARFTPSRQHPGPELRIYRVRPDQREAGGS